MENEGAENDLEMAQEAGRKGGFAYCWFLPSPSFYALIMRDFIAFPTFASQTLAE